MLSESSELPRPAVFGVYPCLHEDAHTGCVPTDLADPGRCCPVPLNQPSRLLVEKVSQEARLLALNPRWVQ